MIAYASRTGTRRNLAALRAAGWRLMVSARGALRPEGFGYALDNGAWTAFTKGEAFCVASFEKAVSLLGAQADWIVIPDIVGEGARSLAFSLSWFDRLAAYPCMLAVQNGMAESDVSDLIGPRCGVFVGGDTPWKLATMRGWSRLAHARGALCHVGRVNTARRIQLCAAADVDSFDGTSASRFAKTLWPLDLARRQPDFEGRHM